MEYKKEKQLKNLIKHFNLINTGISCSALSRYKLIEGNITIKSNLTLCTSLIQFLLWMLHWCTLVQIE